MTQQEHPATAAVERLLNCCEERRGRRSGPGGQHRNKVETAIVLKHLPTGITGEATERRSQEQNRQVAVQRLRVNLALGLRTPPGDQPSELWIQRRRARRIRVAAAHADFPALLAESLDFIAAQGVSDAAQSLGVTTSQLVKLLKAEPRALEQVNALRKQAGERPYQ